MATNKLTQEELQQLQQIQTNNRAVTQEFGQIAILQLDLNNRKANAETYLDNLRKSEVELAKALEDKYGKGSINLETGEIETEDPIPTGAPAVEIPKLQKQGEEKKEKADK